ncbi:MAG: hypothetical protein ACRDP9_22945 [Kribbellaceae bacterium]
MSAATVLALRRMISLDNEREGLTVGITLGINDVRRDALTA